MVQDEGKNHDEAQEVESRWLSKSSCKQWGNTNGIGCQWAHENHFRFNLPRYFKVASNGRKGGHIIIVTFTPCTMAVRIQDTCMHPDDRHLCPRRDGFCLNVPLCESLLLSFPGSSFSLVNTNMAELNKFDQIK